MTGGARLPFVPVVRKCYEMNWQVLYCSLHGHYYDESIQHTVDQDIKYLLVKFWHIHVVHIFLAVRLIATKVGYKLIKVFRI